MSADYLKSLARVGPDCGIDRLHPEVGVFCLR